MISTEKPEGLAPTPNDLDHLPDDVLRPHSHPASIRLGGKDLLTMDKPPLPGETIKVELTLYHKRGGYELVGAAPDKEMAYHCGMVLVNAHVTVDPYTAAADANTPPPDDEEPSMIDRDGQIPDDEDGQDETGDDDAGELEPDDDLGAHDPEFSSGPTR